MKLPPKSGKLLTLIRQLCAEAYVAFDRKGRAPEYEYTIHGLSLNPYLNYHGANALKKALGGKPLGVVQAGKDGELLAVIPFNLLLQTFAQSEPYPNESSNQLQGHENGIQF